MANNIDQLTQKIQQRLRQMLKDMQTIVGNEAVNFVLDNFKEQGFQGVVQNQCYFKIESKYFWLTCF